VLPLNEETDQASNVKIAIKVAPEVSKYFVVREKEWRTMLHHLIELPSSTQKVFAITGVGGCGKTQMVSYFLQEKGTQYARFKTLPFISHIH
jgi:hypothetical protein